MKIKRAGCGLFFLSFVLLLDRFDRGGLWSLFSFNVFEVCRDVRWAFCKRVAVCAALAASLTVVRLFFFFFGADGPHRCCSWGKNHVGVG